MSLSIGVVAVLLLAQAPGDVGRVRTASEAALELSPRPPAETAPTPERAVLLPAPSALAWRPSWSRFRPWQYASLGALTAAQLALFFAVDAPRTPRLTGGVWFDDAIRDGLRASTLDGRLTAKRIADPLYIGLLAYPVVVDALLVAGLVHGEGDTALQLAMIDLQSLLAAGVLAVAAEKGFARERPAGRACREDPASDPECANGIEAVSFFSGHTALTTSAATLLCLHHTRLPLYGGGLGDALACGLGIGASVAVGVLRVASDSHYATDVLTGAAVGFLSGYLLPKALHYGWGDDATIVATPLAGDGTLGLRVSGAF